MQLLIGKVLRDGWRPNLERLEQLDSAGAMTQDDYAEAWAWTHGCSIPNRHAASYYKHIYAPFAKRAMPNR